MYICLYVLQMQHNATSYLYNSIHYVVYLSTYSVYYAYLVCVCSLSDKLVSNQFRLQRTRGKHKDAEALYEEASCYPGPPTECRITVSWFAPLPKSDD